MTGVQTCALPIYARIAGRRKDFLHKLTTRLVRDNQAVVIEDLSVRNMTRNHHLARAISDAAWRQMRTMLEYKCEWYGRDLVVTFRAERSQREHHPSRPYGSPRRTPGDLARGTPAVAPSSMWIRTL